jgi:hypothetical protein
MKEEVELAGLRGKALWRCSRASNLAMFDFGQRRTVRDPRGKEKVVGELALHVQCAWRITEIGRAVVGRHDLYYPADHPPEAIVPGEFDWEHDPNRLDKLISSLFQNGTREFVVTAVQLGNAGGACLSMSDGLFLELFPDHSLMIESWRLFRPGQQGHLVVSGGITH